MATAPAQSMRTTGRAMGWMTRRLAGPGTGRPAPWAVVRTAVALALPPCIGRATGHAALGTLAAVPALFTAMIEPGGGYLRHAQVYGLVAVLDPARNEVARAEARGDAGTALVAVVDALDAILHTVRDIADDARASMKTAGGPSAPRWRRLLPRTVRPA